MVAPLRRRASGRCTFADRVREISHAREDVGAKAEPIAFGATACIAVTAVTKPGATVTEILASNIVSPPESCFPSPPELHRSTQAVPLVQRLAVKLQAAVRGRLTASTAW